MRKWCPEPFDRPLDESPASGDNQLPFEQDSPGGGDLPQGGDLGFEKDLYLSDRHSLWDLMNQVEKDQLLEKAREILQPEYEERESELRRQHEERTAAIRVENDLRLNNWGKEAAAAWNQELNHLSAEAAGLSLALARQIIRDTVKVDPDFLSRTVETALFKIQEGLPLTAVVHPDDAVLLTENPDLMHRLRIDTVLPDRRVEKGGCRLRSGAREWDATLSGQMETLAEVVTEALAEAGGLPLAHAGGEDDCLLD